ncbi:S8 family peptidase [Pengzhenrongella sp.]|jgi:serine protease|uniref:S8 family peptidase n=1 Tax=Pengzhenrongella sp. TaxID=2888820 RepID=UPI002F93207B
MHLLVAAGAASTLLLATSASAAVPGASPAARSAAPVSAPAFGADAADTATDRLIVKYRATTAAGRASSAGDRKARIEQAAATLHATVAHVRDNGLGAQVWQLDDAFPAADVASVTAKIARDDATVEYAEPDREMHALAAAPNDPRWTDLWALKTTSVGINVLGAWDVTKGAGVNVGVIDTGYRPHADLAANIVGGYDMISDTAVSGDGNGRDSSAADPGDYTAANQCAAGEPASNSSWHGTHVSGTIAAVSNNGVGVTGIAPAAKVVPLRTLGTCGGYTSDIADAMIWASGGTVSGLPTNANRARVLNLSLGGSGACDTTSQSAINAARSNGAVVVVAAGNEGVNVSYSSPANCSGVVAVAAYGPTGARAYYSNFGTLVDLAAPGGDQSGGTANGILSTLNAGTTAPGADTYGYYQGTSMATPHVAAVAALMLSANPALTPDQVESRLKSSSRPFVASCVSCGSGMLDANAAVQAAIGATLTSTLTPTASTADYDPYVYNAAGTLVASSELGAGSVDREAATNTAASSAAFSARIVYYAGGTGASNGKYTLGLAW